MVATTYTQEKVSPVDAFWTLIQGQTKAVRTLLTKRLVEQEKVSIVAKASVAKLFTQKIYALENGSEGFSKLADFMSDFSNNADELLKENQTDKYGFLFSIFNL